MFTVALNEDNLFEWKVKLHRLDPSSLLHRDMVAMGIPFLLVALSFPDTFPFAPPFLRIISPKISKGFVMRGGAVCMELLTPRGWASAYSVEAVLVQLCATLVQGQARITRGKGEFTRASAEAAFSQLVATHDRYGWVTPALSDG